MPQPHDSINVDALEEAARSSEYTELYSRLFTGIFVGQMLQRTKGVRSDAWIDRLARIYAEKSTKLFANADFTKVLPRLQKDRHAPVKALIKDALKFPPNSPETAASMLQEVVEIYRQVGRAAYRRVWGSEKSKADVTSSITSYYPIYVSTAVEAAETVLIRVIDDNPDIEGLLPEDELIELVSKEVGPSWEKNTFEELGQKMAKANGSQTREPSKTWNPVKNEVVILVCTSQKKYDHLRKRIRQVGTTTQTAVVPMIAAAVAVSIGATSGAIIGPMVALALLLVVWVGKEVFCSQNQVLLSKPIVETKARRRGKAKKR
jgi:hypothetical protein